MSNPIAVVAEAQGDFEVAKLLIDQTILRTVDWISESDIDTHRTYVGRDDSEDFVKWQQIETERNHDYRRTLRGALNEDFPKHPVHLRIQRVNCEFTIQSSNTGRPSPFIVILIDTDAKTDVLDALKEWRERYLNLLIGIAHTESECWLIAAFDPRTDEEQERLSELGRGENPGIGFDPRAQSERLTATKREYEKLSPKRVLNHLTNGDQSRAMNGMRNASHQILKDRGKKNGLADFLTDLEERMIRALFGR